MTAELEANTTTMTAGYFYQALAVFLLLTHEGEALQCYECKGEECSPLSQSLLKQCPESFQSGREPYCLKIAPKAEFANLVPISRRCTLASSSGKISGRFETEYYCNDFDGCNQAGRTKPKFFFTTIPIFLIVGHMFLF